MQQKVKQKLVSLYTGELFAVFTFAIIWILYIQLFDWSIPYLGAYSSLYAFGLLEFILLQGSYYWYLKLQQLKQGDLSRLSAKKLRTFSFFKRMNAVFIVIGLFILAYLMIRNQPERYWFLFLYLFAAIENINYYYVRLSYQTLEELKELKRQKGFRRSRLAKELDSFYIGEEK
ncbi:hypothetical protein J7E38_14325 [Bacillus sp. ISL-35]|nr:hypothetical protein [Bacillus sp. ISL-35]